MYENLRTSRIIINNDQSLDGVAFVNEKLGSGSLEKANEWQGRRKKREGGK